jgi:uncharacterized protein (DUF433 family)
MMYPGIPRGENMTRYPLNLPSSLKEEAQQLAARQGISLNQFIMWSVSEKVASLRNQLDDPDFPGITFRRGASGWVTPVLRGTGIRVQTLVIDTQQGLKPEEIAEEYGLNPDRICEALSFYDAHRPEIDAAIAAEQDLESADA